MATHQNCIPTDSDRDTASIGITESKVHTQTSGNRQRLNTEISQIVGKQRNGTERFRKSNLLEAIEKPATTNLSKSHDKNTNSRSTQFLFGQKTRAVDTMWERTKT